MKHLLLLLSSFVILHSSFAQSLALDLFDGNNFSQVDVPTGANALLGFDANGLPVRVTAGTGITISGNVITSSGGSGGTWGTIAGTITNQTDLMSLFNLKAPILNPTFTGAVTIPAGGTIYGGMNFFITASGGLVMTDTVDDDLVASAWQIRDEDNALTAEMLTDGTLTATSFVGNGNALTFLNANNLDGALPAINGFLLTDLNASALTSGTLPNARLVSIPNSALANSSITINGSAVSLGGSTTIATGLTIGTTAITGGTSGTLLYDNGGVLGKLTPTGTGSPVLSTSATLVTPALGTPTALVLTNATGLPPAGVTGTAAILGANTFTGAQTLTAVGVASTPPLYLTGTILATGTGTTNFPNVLIQPTGATASTTWSTSGTAIGVNLNLNAGRFIDCKVDGSSAFFVGSDGVVSTNSIAGVTQPTTGLNVGGYLPYATAFTSFTGELAAVGLVLGPASESGYIVGNGKGYHFAGAAGWGSIAASLLVDGNEIIAQRHGTAAQTFRLYETDSGSNDEYLELNTTTNPNTIKPVATGSGTASAVRYYVTTTVWLGSRSGTPEAAETAGIGSICTDTATGAVYKKTSGTGNTGWVEMTSGGGGSAPQPLQAVKTDTYSQTSATWTDVTGLTQVFTASSTTQKVLVKGTVFLGTAATTAAGVRLARDGTLLVQGDAASSRTRVHSWFYDAAGNGAETATIEFLDTPGTTSAVTYSVQLMSADGTTAAYVNRTATDADSATFSRPVSTLTVIPFAE